MKKEKTHKIIGIIAACINTLILINSVYLYYCYNFTGKLYMYMYPNHVLLINALIGVVGLSISVMLYKNKVRFMLFLIITMVLWFFTLSNYFFPLV